jgi:beta-N-acetylhexosaminidase
VDEAWVERTLAALSLREKVGQMIMPWMSGAYVAEDSPEFDRLAAWVERDGIGGIVLSVGMPLNVAAKLNALQRRARVPLLVGSDMENGPGMRMSGFVSVPHLIPQGGSTAFPPVMALGAAGSDSLAEALGRVLAAEARAVGVHMVFGPVLDVNSNPENPIINTRSFGEEPALVARLAAAYVRGAHAGGLLTTGKHFPGHGDTETDSHLALPSIAADRARLDSLELAPYRALLPGGQLDGVMSAHIAVTGVEGRDAPPATLSRYFLTDVLRDELRFEGVVFTDAMDMGAVVSRYGAADAVLRAVEAGADVLLMPTDLPGAIDAVVGAVRAGRIAESRLDASVRRILRAKSRAGLPGAAQVPLDRVDDVVAVRAHTDVADEVARRSLTLGRDERGLVPLAPAMRRVLLVTYARTNDPLAGDSLARALRAAGKQVSAARVDTRTTAAELDDLRRRAADVDVIVAAVSIPPVEGAGSVAAGAGFGGWVQSLAAAGRPVVVVSLGSPYLLGAFPAVPAYLLAWSGTDASQAAAASALLGRAPITGTLPVSLPPYHRRGEGIRRAP